MNGFWQGLERRARVGLVAGVVAICVGLGIGTWWMMRSEYQTLFSNLSSEDMGVMVAELDRMKVPYRIADDGHTLLVDKDAVLRTRIKLMAKPLALHGAVGFELFNNADFGMTEFAQKVNFQRALQGEITRTIMSLDEIESARVHLATPEEGLFKRPDAHGKASVTLSLRQGRALSPEQVTGIQRLVAAAVPGVSAQDVTIIDQHGIALTRAGRAGAASAGGSDALDMKRDMETYLTRKVDGVIRQALGEGEALASVDVTLDMQDSQVTTEDVTSAPGKPGDAPSGVLVREREVIQEGSTPLASRLNDNATGASSQRESEYQVGKRVERRSQSAGTLRKVDVVVVSRKPLDVDASARLREAVAAAVGAVPSRGDTIVVQTFARTPATASDTTVAPTSTAVPPSQVAAASASPSRVAGWLGMLLAVVALALLVWLAAFASRRKAVVQPARLTSSQRDAALLKIRAWMQETPPARQAGAGGDGV
ncbi:flagellar basal-body MS-ring/collar protein FliF [Pandoraea bronchicola]|uniref:Flagellar M-ring protein FliF n=1 Tax=Pandoraea bronchicola TaxID=2508287 RepID=A0A5E5C2A5_9BURK|nr:flagellar basal-body MS-ring/collar protein FliF [Pandoraea bronchicola]VVE90693.1 flagellar M-ring protein FliF [Pandoraea bronchicola]